jgi:hypothetical protein
MMKRLLGAFVDDFGPQIGQELFAEAQESLRRAAEEAEHEERTRAARANAMRKKQGHLT